ncbi:uncharacterized protein E0L32_005984 [Thyridium curvatum]|uniref:AGC-kinase C-terminal domain-containing protein n=1 Tax=Thyridium curvatum TaxID=1093900 RepID=A0A507B0U0_9PEZI|nr:uncharacterized protein E0L32_005984 [Thyridium curvatum]TPX13513.1 hypothetical protein E0L32_005984 [Thyridium curvatum]
MFQRFHRRGPSNPSSPSLPDQTSPWDTASSPDQLQPPKEPSSRGDARSQSPGASNLPPSLPPIPRVLSGDFSSSYPFEHQNHHHDHGPDPALRSDSQSPPTKSPYNGTDQGFIGGVALRKYRQSMQDAGKDAELPALPSQNNRLPENLLSRSKPPPPPIDTSFSQRPPPIPLKQVKPASSFATPTELQNVAAGPARRPAGTRLASDSTVAASTQPVSETHKARKGLPFLKNPMSTLLNRRRAGQGPSDISPVPPPEEPNEFAYAPIRGTRVHDFSAPRPKPRPGQPGDGKTSGRRDALGLPMDSSYGSMGQSSDTTGPFTEISSVASHGKPSGLIKSVSGQSWASEDRHSEAETIPPVPPKDSPDPNAQRKSRSSKTPSIDSSPGQVRYTPSDRTGRSRNVSLSDASIKDGPSAIPRHMKSTSSRFSFMVGSANQELLLEERHRQKELEKQGSTPNAGTRDSRFDDFDEDSFDYDAMMDDDGLEERIPGVNADAEDDYAFEEENIYENESVYEDEMDPDNDQENFAGFVFQRSNPTSSLATPHTAGNTITPRDATGNAIGFAMTKDQTPDVSQPPSATTYQMEEATLRLKADDIEGLGIQGLRLRDQSEGPEDAVPITEEQTEPRGQRLSVDIPKQPTNLDDGLYFDEGLMDELNFGDPGSGDKFDESIFDLNDTDEYGRPIPGAFAQAQAQRLAMSQDASKRESNATSRLSGQSQVSQSTTHTSMSVGLQHMTSISEKRSEPETFPHGHEIVPAMLQSPLTGQDRVAAYQAALAEAAHKAAASGKFRRGSSPPPLGDSTLLSPSAGEQDELDEYGQEDPAFDDYDDGAFTQDMDDYDFDDDAIIAAANAEALANDMDGFYGQEFGFYSAPAHQGHGHGHSPSKPASTGSAPLNEQNLYEYAAGGYFGPSGLGRSKSGRIVSREPNLTPITERSEYSNRNSVMSLGFPPGGVGSAGDLRSPGLAQLAMMADDSDMTLSALMRLRSRAFGGSQASLASSREGSPKSAAGDREGATSPWNINGGQTGFLGVRDSSHGRMGSQTGFSVRSRDSDAGSASGSPTLTMNMPMPVSSPSPMPIIPPLHPHRSQSPAMIGSLNGCPPVLEDDETFDDTEPPSAMTGASTGSMANSGLWMSPGEGQQFSQGSGSLSSPATNTATTISPQQQQAPPGYPPSASSSSRSRPGMGHRHKGSADSISYMKEEEESGETRWVMERRRTAETGEVEILERGVVEGGRI